VSGSYRYDKVF